MTSLARRRWLAPALALSLGVGIAGVVAAPASAVRTTFSYDDGVTIRDPIHDGGSGVDILDDGTADPYPSTMSFEDDDAAVITDVDVLLFDVEHDNPDDIDVLLVGPSGRQVTLMSDAGGDDPMTPEDLTFDDEATGALPDSTPITEGTYRPSNYGGTDDFPDPAPADSGNTSLSVFDGTSTIGEWNLYVVDDNTGEAGAISGWELHFRVKSGPYPSRVSVSGLGTKISDVNITLEGLSHSYLDDVDVLLVGPGGQQAVVMSDVGGSSLVNNLDLAFDDEASASLNEDDTATSGTYKPSDLLEPNDPDFFDPSAPPVSGNTALSTFDGTDPNGTWRLFVVDDAEGDQGTLDGWSIDIETDNGVPTGTVAVNGGAATATSRTVALSVSAADPGTPTSGVTSMRFSNDGTTWSAFQPVAATAAWTLSTGDGTKTVYAQFRDGSGNLSTAATDTIVLDSVGPTAKKLTPKKNATDVEVTSQVKIKASEALKGSTVTAKTVFLKAKGSSKKVKAKVSYNASGKSIVLKPKSSLDKGTKYTVTVTTRVLDVAGNGFDAKPAKAGAQALKFSFTTA